MGVLKIPTENSILQRSATKRPRTMSVTLRRPRTTSATNRPRSTIHHDINYQLPSTIRYYEATISTISYHINKQLLYEQSATKRQEVSKSRHFTLTRYKQDKTQYTIDCVLGNRKMGESVRRNDVRIQTRLHKKLHHPLSHPPAPMP